MYDTSETTLMHPFLAKNNNHKLYNTHQSVPSLCAFQTGRVFEKGELCPGTWRPSTEAEKGPLCKTEAVGGGLAAQPLCLH